MNSIRLAIKSYEKAKNDVYKVLQSDSALDKTILTVLEEDGIKELTANENIVGAVVKLKENFFPVLDDESILEYESFSIDIKNNNIYLINKSIKGGLLVTVARIKSFYTYRDLSRATIITMSSDETNLASVKDMLERGFVLFNIEDNNNLFFFKEEDIKGFQLIERLIKMIIKDKTLIETYLNIKSYSDYTKELESEVQPIIK